MPLDEKVKKAVARDVEEYLIEKIANITNINLDKIKGISEDTHFTNDLLFDSLDYDHLIVDIEDDFNIEVEQDAKFFTKKQCREYVVQKIEEREEGYNSKKYQSTD